MVRIGALCIGLLFGVVFATSCQLKPACGLGNCNGCCDANGTCQGGQSNIGCGSHGNQCTSCGAGLACLAAGTCGDPGTGGGSATGGGGGSSTGGGGASTGGGTGGGVSTGGGTGGGGTGGGGTGGGGIVASPNVTVIVEPNGNKASELINAIKAATSSVLMTMYEIDNTDVLSALVARHAAGVSVKVILDSSTNTKGFNTPAFNQLSQAGIAVVWSNPTFNFTHEKCVIIDGATAWIMTMNLNASTSTDNREYLAIDTDASDVAEATAIFDADFAMTAITPTGNLVVAPVNARGTLHALIGLATSTVDLEVEELSDENPFGIVTALTAAAGRGVTVRVIISNETLTGDQATAVQQVKQAGGTVVMTGPKSGNGSSSNPYIHAKAITLDCSGTSCAMGWVGSENMSAGSLGYNREVGVIIDAPAELGKIETAINTDFAKGVVQ